MFYSKTIYLPYVKENTSVAVIDMLPENDKSGMKEGDRICFIQGKEKVLKATESLLERDYTFIEIEHIRAVIRDGKFIGLQDFFYIEASRLKKEERTYKSLNIFIPNYFDESATENVCQDGTVLSCPLSYSQDALDQGSEYIDLKPGDKIYFHHFVTTEYDQAIEFEGTEFYEMPYHQIFCKVDSEGNIIMQKDYNFVEPIEIPESELISPHGFNIANPAAAKNKYRALEGILKYPSPRMIELGFKPNDRIKFIPGSEYKIDIEGKLYYRIVDRFIDGRYNEVKKAS